MKEEAPLLDALHKCARDIYILYRSNRAAAEPQIHLQVNKDAQQRVCVVYVTRSAVAPPQHFRPVFGSLSLTIYTN